MAAQVNKEPSSACVIVIEEITRIYKSLPPRPSITEVEAAISILKSVEAEEKKGLEEISNQVAPQDVPTELYSILQQVRTTMVLFQSQEQKKEAIQLVELDKTYQNFDELIQKASEFISGVEPVGEIVSEAVISDESLIKQNDVEVINIDSLKRVVTGSSVSSSGIKHPEKYSLMKVAALIEDAAKTGARFVDLHSKLMDKTEWLPMSLGKLANVDELNLADNQLMVLPNTIDNLKALTKLDVHSNQIINLPDSFGELLNLIDLDLHSNRLKSLPASFGKLTNLINLDLGSNRFTCLPDFVGNLTSLKRLNLEMNELEELPYTIGFCSSLVELRLDFNQLKALPEAVGNFVFLEILTLHYNRIKGFPTTMGNLSCLRELDVSFNEVENIPETFCFVVSLEKLNLSNNFADLRTLPRSIGNLENLEELDISNSQIRILPDSFRFLSKLKTFHADGTPLEVPPGKLIKLGAQAVVEYMADFVTKTEFQAQRPKKKRAICSRICLLFCH